MPGSSTVKTHRTQDYKGLLILFALIPGFRRNPEAPPAVTQLTELSADTNTDTVKINLRPSLRLWFIQRIVHGLLLVSLSFAVIPLVPAQPLWVILWITGLIGLGVSLQMCYRSWRGQPQTLCITERGWLLRDSTSQRDLVLSDDAVVLPWLIVLPCRDKTSRARIYLVIPPDCTSPEEHRRLRVWLRTRR